MSRRNLPVGNGLTEDSNLPSIYRLPARAAFVSGPGGEPPLRGDQSKNTLPGLQPPKHLPPEGSNTLAGWQDGEGVFWLGGVPKGKWMGSNSSNSGTPKAGLGGSRGSLPPCRGPGTKSLGKGVDRDPRFLRGSVQGEGPRSKALFLGAFPP